MKSRIYIKDGNICYQFIINDEDLVRNAHMSVYDYILVPTYRVISSQLTSSTEILNWQKLPKWFYFKGMK